VQTLREAVVLDVEHVRINLPELRGGQLDFREIVVGVPVKGIVIGKVRTVLVRIVLVSIIVVRIIIVVVVVRVTIVVVIRR